MSGRRRPSRGNSIRPPRSTPRKSTTWRSPRWTSRSNIGGRHLAERGRQGGQELLEAQALGEQSSIRLRSRAPAKASLRRRSRSTRSSGQAHSVRTESKESTPSMGPPARSGSDTASACPRARSSPDRSPPPREARPVRENRTTSPRCSRLDRPGELVGVHDARQRLDARPRPRDADPRPAFDVFVEAASIHAQERDDLLEPALERRIDVARPRCESTRPRAPRGASRTAAAPPARAVGRPVARRARARGLISALPARFGVARSGSSRKIPVRFRSNGCSFCSGYPPWPSTWASLSLASFPSCRADPPR